MNLEAINRRNLRLITAWAVLSLIGVAVAVYQSVLFYQIRGGTAGFKSFCNFGEGANCDVILSSSYAELVAGIPISSFAAGLYLTFFLVSFLLRDPSALKRYKKIGLILTGFGSVVSLIYLGIMVGKIGTLCLFCLITDVVSFGSLGLVAALKPSPAADKGPVSPTASDWKTTAIMAGLSLAAAVVLLKSADPGAPNQTQIHEQVSRVLSRPAVEISVSENEIILGKKEAPVTIIEYSDFQCPFCKMGAVTLNTVLNRFPNDVRVVFRTFPLDMNCNPGMTRPLHLNACEAARLAHCAEAKGNFKPVYEEIFERQEEINSQVLRNIAQNHGINEEEYTACQQNAEINQKIAVSIQSGIDLGIQSTPTFFINGRKMEGVAPLAEWDSLIKSLRNENR